MRRSGIFSINAFLFSVILVTLFACNGQREQTTRTDIESIHDTLPPTVVKNDDLVIRDTITITNKGAAKIHVSSAGNHIMYRSCGNELLFDVPPEFGEISLTASGAQAIASKMDKRKFLIVPTEKNCEISVFENKAGTRVLSSTYHYRVINPPKPVIELSVNGRNFESQVPVPKTSRIHIKLEPDPEFRAAFPNDASYQIDKVDVLAQLSLGPPTLVNSISGSGKDATQAMEVALGTRVRQVRPGTVIFIKVGEVYRVNYQNQKIKVEMSAHEKTFVLVVK